MQFHSKIRTSLLTLVSVCGLSACSSTTDFRSFSFAKKNAEISEYEQNLNAHFEEWQTMKPNIVELLKLESELRYLISQLEVTDLSQEVQISLKSPQDTRFTDPSFSMSEAIESALDLSLEQLKTFDKNEDEVRTDTFDEETHLKITENIDDDTHLSIAANIDSESHLLITENFDDKTHLSIASEFEVSPAQDNMQSSDIANAKPSDNLETSVDANYAQSIKSRAGMKAFSHSLSLESSAVAPDISSNVVLGRAAPTLKDSDVMSAKFSDNDSASSQLSARENSKFRTGKTGEAVKPEALSLDNIDNKFNVVNNTSENLQQSPLKNEECSPTAAPTLGGIGIHLASYSNINAAQEGWQVLKNSMPSLLCDKYAAIKEVTVKSKLYFAVRVGPFADTASATQACARFSSINQYCSRSLFEGVLMK